MIIKKKSLVVALTSSFIISSVLVLTLVGYVMYIELKSEEFKIHYQEALQKLNVKIYSKYMEVSKLEARLEGPGALKGKAVIEGIIINRGHRDISNILMKVKFLDKEGASIYEVVFHPHEPSLGESILGGVTIPYLADSSKAVLKPNEGLPFKKVLTDCPDGIITELRKGGSFSKDSGTWSGKFAFEILSLDL